jgi:hypothetical protein
MDPGEGIITPRSVITASDPYRSISLLDEQLTVHTVWSAYFCAFMAVEDQHLQSALYDTTVVSG